MAFKFGRRFPVGFALSFVIAAFVTLAASAVFLAPVGANLAHSLNPKRLKQFFAVGLLIMSLNMLREAIFVG